jgi:hypothetical protein
MLPWPLNMLRASQQQYMSAAHVLELALDSVLAEPEKA